MRDASHPPRPGVRREIDRDDLSKPEDVNEFRHRVDTIVKCGLAAEVTVNGTYVTLYATRRVRTGRSE